MPGAEAAGVVRSAPAGAHVSAGDRVAALTMLSGGMAQVIALPPEQVFALPDTVSFEAGAGILFNDLTVHFALTQRGRLANGETVLVHGAAGGIGTSALRLAPALGAARTIAVVSTQDKADIARAAGATDVVLADGFKDAVREMTGGRGVDIVVDPVGGDRFTDSLRSLARGGRLLVVGFTGGAIPPHHPCRGGGGGGRRGDVASGLSRPPVVGAAAPAGGGHDCAAAAGGLPVAAGR